MRISQRHSFSSTEHTPACRDEYKAFAPFFPNLLNDRSSDVRRENRWGHRVIAPAMLIKSPAPKLHWDRPSSWSLVRAPCSIRLHRLRFRRLHRLRFRRLHRLRFRRLHRLRVLTAPSWPPSTNNPSSNGVAPVLIALKRGTNESAFKAKQ